MVLKLLTIAYMQNYILSYNYGLAVLGSRRTLRADSD